MNHLLEKIKQKNASAFTHSGKFHADDVFSAALLLYLNLLLSSLHYILMELQGHCNHIHLLLHNNILFHLNHI